MNLALEKIQQAKNLLIEAETFLIDEKGFCPYELGVCIRSFDDAISAVENIE